VIWFGLTTYGAWFWRGIGFIGAFLHRRSFAKQDNEGGSKIDHRGRWFWSGSYHILASESPEFSEHHNSG
jgi:hypothetical protein